MVKGAYVDKDGLKKGAWSEEEDNKLRSYIVRYGHWNWRLLPKFAGNSIDHSVLELKSMNHDNHNHFFRSTKMWKELQIEVDELPETRCETRRV